MAGSAPQRPARSVLIVEDEHELGELYQQWLMADYEVTAVTSGERAIELIDRDWDAVLLDRRMPGMTGDEVLSAMREDGHQYPVAMVTAVEPDFDIIEMGFDDYVVKPVNRNDLVELLERMTDMTDYDSGMQRYFSLASKKAALEANKTQEQLDQSPEYQALLRRLNEVQKQVGENRDRVVQSPRSDAAFNDRLGRQNTL